MTEFDEQIERLIVRKLDGELSLEEEHELNKVLIRSPEAHQLLDDYARQDELVASVMKAEIGSAAPPDLSVVTAGAAPLAQPHRYRSWTATSIGGLLVACLALFAVLMEPALRNSPPAADNGAKLGGIAIPVLPVSQTRGDRFEVLPAYMEFPQTEEDSMDRQFVVVHNEKTGQYYVLEVRREQTTTRLMTGEF